MIEPQVVKTELLKVEKLASVRINDTARHVIEDKRIITLESLQKLKLFEWLRRDSLESVEN